MQELTRKAELSRLVARSVCAVNRIPHDGMTRVLHVNADLVGAPGEKLALDERIAVIVPIMLEPLENAKRGDGLPCRRDVVATAMRVRSLALRAMGASIIRCHVP